MVIRKLLVLFLVMVFFIMPVSAQLTGSFIDEPTNPVLTATDAWESGGVIEPSMIMNGNIMDIWYRGGSSNERVGYATATDSNCSQWNKSASNPLTDIPIGYNLPYVLLNDSIYYMFVKNSGGDGNIYLYNSTNKINWTVMNSGNPVLTHSTTASDWNYTIYNVGVTIVNGTWHMLYEGKSSTSQFRIGYSYSNLIDLNWNIHTSSNIIFDISGNPYLTYVPDRNSLLVIHGEYSGSPDHWEIIAHHANMSEDLSLAANWHLCDGFDIINHTNIHDADPHMCITSFTKDYNIIIAYCHDQNEINQVYSNLSLNDFYDAICLIASAASPEFDDVSWDQDPYYTGETANITTNILNFDDGTYSYYLDLYNTNDYLTTFELTSESESNYYTFPLGWTDTSLLAKLVRVTDPYATNEVQLAYDISHFETLDWDTTVSFNKSSYNPSETLKVTWSGAANGSDVWLRAGDDGEVLESDVAYSGSFTFNVPANTTETYYIVDVITGGYSQVQASCVISSIPDFYFNYSVAVDQDEYVHGDWVTMTYSTDTPAVIKVFGDTNADIWHYLDVPAAVTNETWIYYIGDTDPFGSYSVLFGNDDFLVSDYYSVVSSTSFVQVVPESMYMYETMTIWYVTNGSSTLSITDWWDSILFNQTVNSSSLESISYVPVASGELTITLSDVPADATDSIIVYWAADPDDVPDDDDVIEDDVIEDVLDDDETMTEYFDDKFREFAPSAWGIFLLSIILWLMAILTSFGGSSKRR